MLCFVKSRKLETLYTNSLQRIKYDKMDGIMPIKYSIHYLYKVWRGIEFLEISFSALSKPNLLSVTLPTTLATSHLIQFFCRNTHKFSALRGSTLL